ncbi:hypothetical protein F0562_002820 [Nyssa sinensis]|uniref:J domain-containing protein n=1 Tax=Nyssa sinensis TaxID=561372 RepID=A0A5J5BYU5_9ASTE|nr:hypothetical protein F0562_002820 [Nyssa sinensis]
MDEFGVLVESIGFKTQGKSAPMADLKGRTNINNAVSRNLGINLGSDNKPSSVNRSNSAYDWNSVNGSFDSDLDGIFRSNNNQKTQNYAGLDNYDDVFGGPTKSSKPLGGRGGGDVGSVFDLESVFKGSNDLDANTSASYVYGDDIFGGPTKSSKPLGGPGGGDVGSVFDLESVFKGSNDLDANTSASYVYGDDIFGGMPGKSTVSVNYDDAFGSMASPPKQSASIDNLFGNFGGMGLESSSSRNSGEVEKNSHEFDDLIPGFGGSSPPKNRENSETRRPQHSSGQSANSTSNLAEDPFVVLESSSSPPHTSSGLFSDPLKGDTGKNSVASSIDGLEDFAMGRVRISANEQSDFGDIEVETSFGAMKEARDRTEDKKREQRGAFESENDLESFFGMGAQPNSKPRPNTKAVDPVFDTLFQTRGPEVAQKTSGTSSSTKRTSSVGNIVDDFSFMFGAAPSSEEFQEIEGESEERRRARLNHHLRTQERMAKALAEKNQRDFQTQQEQEERHRISETLDDDIKRWAARKEGNLRALLSSLQYVLWPECGWQPVSLTDLITSISVKKVYYKATLCVHPDKVQQKGADLQQKYIAEKVFDLLKEAWNKFNSEEL